MKLKIPTTSTVEATAIRVDVPLRYWDEEDERERLQGLPGVVEKPNGEYLARLVLVLDLETRKVRDWPPGRVAHYDTIKVCDEGTYTLLGRDAFTVGPDVEIARIDDNYVPSCVPEGGDYVSFRVAADGSILTDDREPWNPTAKSVADCFYSRD